MLRRRIPRTRRRRIPRIRRRRIPRIRRRSLPRVELGSRASRVSHMARVDWRSVTIVRSPLRARLLSPAKAAPIALIAIASFGGCFVSFDGYQLAQSGAAGELTLAGAAGQAGSSNGAAGRALGGDGGTTPSGDGGVPDEPAAGTSSAGQIAVEAGHGGRSVGAAGGGTG